MVEDDVQHPDYQEDTKVKGDTV
jgi:hypothetical protein